MPFTELSLDDFIVGHRDQVLETVLAQKVSKPDDFSLELAAMITRIGKILEL